MGIKVFHQASEIIEFNPKKLFIIDGLGAILSAFLLGVVLVGFESIFGIPKSTLYCLAFFPCLFAIYDFYCFFMDGNNISLQLKGIAILNLLYCCLSVGLIIYHHHRITKYGWAYLMIEIIIVLALAYYELKTARRVKIKNFEKQPAANIR